MMPSQLDIHKRRCMKNGCTGTLTTTKTLGPHLIMETIYDTFDSNTTLRCNISDVPTEIIVGTQM
jgi:hypothetical protein